MTNRDGVRHEDATALTFADNSLDVIATFEVLEHVPDYRSRPGGVPSLPPPGRHTVIMTVPST